MLVHNRTLWALIVALSSLCPLQARSPDAVFDRAFALYQAGSVPEAQALLTAALNAHPSALDFSLLGTIEVQEGNLTSAEEHIRKALAIEPGLRGARFTLATVLEAQGKSAEAEAAFEMVIAVDKRNVQALLAMARLKNKERNTEAALAFSLKAKAITPRDSAVLYVVGTLCLQMDLIKDATDNLEQAASIDPNPAIMYALGSARVANRDLASAKKIYADLLKSEPNNPQVNYALGATYFLSSETELAKPYFERCIQLQPDQVESFYYLGEIANQEGRQ